MHACRLFRYLAELSATGIAFPPVVCLSFVTLVHPTQRVELLCNIFAPYCSLVILLGCEENNAKYSHPFNPGAVMYNGVWKMKKSRSRSSLYLGNDKNSLFSPDFDVHWHLRDFCTAPMAATCNRRTINPHNDDDDNISSSSSYICSKRQHTAIEKQVSRTDRHKVHLHLP